MAKKEITQEVIAQFLEGRDPQERIVNLEYSYNDDFITVYYRDEEDNKCRTMEPFLPFLWAKKSACQKLCNGDRKEVTALLKKYGIWVKQLDVTNTEGEVVEEILDGYTYMFYALKPMSYKKFLDFFKEGKNPVYKNDKDKQDKEEVSKKDSKQYLTVTPKEQFLISTGKRMFKGYEDYNDCLRMIFDLETTGLDTKKDRIEQFGIRFNRKVKYKGEFIDFEKIFSVEGKTEDEKNKSEIKNIVNFIKIIYTFKPDIITAHNGETFDWNMIIDACERLGIDLVAISKEYFDGAPIAKNKRETILKLGGEIERFNQTIVPTVVVTDSLHAVRRAQALDSNMLFSNLKYVSKYSSLIKEDRVYIPGDRISEVWNDTTRQFALNKKTGDWYILDESHVSENEDILNKKGKDNENFVLYTKEKLLPDYEIVSGREIAERYLLDDLWECDMVEHRYNTPNFLICKMIPVPFQKCCTMGTAGQWKSIMLAWSYENNLAIPPFGDRKTFPGGLSRLLKVGFVNNVAKFDYNSLYPSIILTWGITDSKDLLHSMLYFLEHVLTQREKYKNLKKAASKNADKIKSKLQARDYSSKEEGRALNAQMMKYYEEESANDKKQLPLKIFGNSFFGSYGAPNVFPWGSIDCAARTTCTGRMALRLMIYWFNKLGYKPIVGDSFSSDTPIFIKYKDNNNIDIVPVKELINEDFIEKDALDREYDYSKKDFYVLCRSGWVEPTYIYRHKTDKDIFEVRDMGCMVEVTEDHSLFNDKQDKIKPSEITEETKLEYYSGEILDKNRILTTELLFPEFYANKLINGELDRVPTYFLNRPHEGKKLYDLFMKGARSDVNYSKTCIAGLQFIKKETSIVH